MGIRGRKPKPEGQTRHRNRPVHDWTEVPDVPFKGGPKLPARRWNGRAWSPADRRRWKAWSSMPHCVLWCPATWEFAFMTIELASMVNDGEPRWSAEVRARERVLGTTQDALRDQRIRYVTPEAESRDTAATVTNIIDYRDL